jgi:hypothetical protein
MKLARKFLAMSTLLAAMVCSSMSHVYADGEMPMFNGGNGNCCYEDCGYRNSCNAACKLTPIVGVGAIAVIAAVAVVLSNNTGGSNAHSHSG